MKTNYPLSKFKFNRSEIFKRAHAKFKHDGYNSFSYCLKFMWEDAKNSAAKAEMKAQSEIYTEVQKWNVQPKQEFWMSQYQMSGSDTSTW